MRLAQGYMIRRQCGSNLERPIIEIQPRISLVLFMGIGTICGTDPACESYTHGMSRRLRKPTICICENKGADQLCSNCTADQRLCFRYTDRTVLLHKIEISSLWPSFVLVQLGLCRICSETTLMVSSRRGSYVFIFIVRAPHFSINSSSSSKD